MFLSLRQIPVTAITLLLFSCGQTSEDQASDSESGIPEGPEITYEHVFDIKDSDEVMFNRISDLRVTSGGDILILDAGASKAHLFDSGGNYLASGIGEGAGPGEARFPNGLLGMNTNDEFLIFGQALRRFSLYSIENQQIIPQADIPSSRFASEFALQADGSILLFERASNNPEGDERERLSVMNREGEIVRDAYLTFPGSESIVVTNPDGLTMVTFRTPNSRASRVVFYDNTMIMVVQTELGFRRYDLDTGELLTEVKIDMPEAQVSEEENRDFLDSIMGAFELSSSQRSELLSQMPDVRGLVSSVRYDSAGYVWLQLLPQNIDDVKNEWLVFTEEGEYSGRLILDETGVILYVRNGTMYLRTVDDDEFPMIRVLKSSL